MTNEQLWQAVLGELELSISKANFTTWFKNTSISRRENQKIIIAVPNAFTQTWLEKKYHPAIIKALKNLTNNEVHEVFYKIEPIQQPVFPYQQKETLKTAAPANAVVDEFGLNNKYVFENFIVGKSNELAHAACKAITENLGHIYNPLFIYGGVGLGKTHLIQAVGNQILKKAPATKILYASCERFTNDYIEAVKKGRAKEFQDRYRNIDVLLMDDIQFMTGKERTQEAFYHTFNALHQNDKQIVLTADRPPKAIASLEERLLTRFEWGMTADIQNPDLETRIAILRAKCQEKNFSLPPDIINYLAATIHNNIRELEGALNRIIAHCQLQHAQLDLNSVKKMLSSLTTTYQKKSLTPKQIINTVADFYDTKIEDITGNSRKKELVVPRQIIMFLMREEIRSSFPTIGNELGGRDHTTAMHAVDKIAKAFENDEKIRQEILSIKQRLYNA